jgi:hypothetical protein
MEYIYYRPRRGFTHRLVLLVRALTRKETEGNVTMFDCPFPSAS